MVWFGFMVFNATFNNISVITWQSILLVEETRVPRENHQPVARHWQTLSHNVVLSTHVFSFFVSCAQRFLCHWIVFSWMSCGFHWRFCVVASKLKYRDREYIVPCYHSLKQIYKYFYFDTLFFFLDDQTACLEKQIQILVD